jgi:nicotinamide mononucleotide (NMN) deamidase PncC
LDSCGIVSIDGSPDEARYSFQGGGSGDVFSLIAMAVSILLRRGQTISFAESVTGGMFSDLWHGEADVGRVLRGTVVVSGDESVWSILCISEIFLGNFGHCSREVAIAMADGIRKLLNSDFSIAIAAKDCSDRAVYLSIRTPTREIVQRIDLSHATANRELMRERACYAACKIFLQVLFEEPL